MKTPQRRVGIFGGSFDPVHNAHVALARLAVDELQLDELLWVPTGHPYQKTRAVTAAEHRVAMVALAIQGQPKFALSRIEVERHGPSYMIDTVRELRAQQPGVKWYLMIGQDQYASFQSWQGWRELLSLVTIAIANRPDAHLQADPEVLAVAHEAVALPMMDISSTDIRERIAQGASIDDLVPAAVAGYIARHHLYREPPVPPPLRS